MKRLFTYPIEFQQPGKLASILWFFGSSLLHTGVVIKSLNREYAFGGHERPGASGVYWTRPRQEPPGGTFRCEILQGFTFRSDHDVESVIKDISRSFSGTSYNLLSCNCNHFTSSLCEKLTGRKPPTWLNRAARIGVALPCIVPREWVAPPDYDSENGELLEESDEDDNTSLLQSEQTQIRNFHGSLIEDNDDQRGRQYGENGRGKNIMRDTAGRVLPSSEQAPLSRFS